MRIKDGFLTLLVLFCGTASIFSQNDLVGHVYNHVTTSLNGSWNYIIDPYENGYYNYRYEPFDQLKDSWASAFFLNSQPKDSTDLLEYDIDGMESLQVPGDWNIQYRLLCWKKYVDLN